MKKNLPRNLLQLDKADVILQGSGVEIAVLDSGIHFDHEVFSSKEHGTIDGMNFVGGVQDLQYKIPETHGTAVAATVAGNTYTCPKSASNPRGACIGGIAPKANLYICRVFDGRRTEWEWIIQALDHLIQLKRKNRSRIDIVVMAFGEERKRHDVEIKMKALAEEGVILIAAGGNRGPLRDEIDFPASDTNVIPVGAIDCYGNTADFSAANCHVYAPGKEVCVPAIVPYSPNAPDCHRTAVATMNGTSFAAPMLAGFLALLLESANQCPAVVHNVREFIVKKCHDINFLKTLLRDHKLVKDGKLAFSYDFIKNIQADPYCVARLVKEQYPNDVKIN